MRLAPSTAWRLILALVALGLVGRTYHMVRCPPVWHDEAALIINALNVPFTAMLGPLLYSEASPPLFLASEHAAALLLGDGVIALRLIPFLAGCISLVCFAGLAWRTLNPTAAVLAVGLFAVSDRLLWHSIEAKPYATDVLAAVGLSLLYVQSRSWSLASRYTLFGAVAPVVIWGSYPGCFLLGGLLVGELPDLYRAGWTDRLRYVVWASVVAGSFGVLVLGPVSAQRVGPMELCWEHHFPDWSHPWLVPVWSVGSFLEVLRYALVPVGQVLILLTLLGVRRFWHQGRGGLVAVLVLPMFLAFVAACLHKYPFGGSRLEVFAAPGLILLTAAGAGVACRWLAERSRFGLAVVVIGLSAPVVQTCYRAIHPWPQADCAAAADYVRGHAAPTDGLLFNHWEYAYYFRDISDRWIPWEGVPPAELSHREGRVWAVVTAQSMTDDKRASLAKTPGWEVLDRKMFRFTTVLLMERRDVVPKSTGE